MAEKYTQKIMDNIQVTIQDIHIRYEDGITSQRTTWVDEASNAFAAGLTVDSIELKSFFCDLKSGGGLETWVEKFVEEEQRYLVSRTQIPRQFSCQLHGSIFARFRVDLDKLLAITDSL